VNVKATDKSGDTGLHIAIDVLRDVVARRDRVVLVRMKAGKTKSLRSSRYQELVGRESKTESVDVTCRLAVECIGEVELSAQPHRENMEFSTVLIGLPSTWSSSQLRNSMNLSDIIESARFVAGKMWATVMPASIA
jgi:hypothetical protein